MPIGSIIRFRNADSFSTSALCGLILGEEGYVNECVQTLNDEKSIDCKVNSYGKTFTICCYNILMRDSVALTSVKIVFPLDTSITGLDAYVNSDIYLPLLIPDNVFTWNTFNQSNAAININGAKIIETFYNIAQESAFTKVTFKIDLNREVTRDTKIIINGDFSAMVINNSIPRCVASTTNSSELFGYWGTGDVLIDSCSAANINLNSKSIIIITKRIIYKCNQNYSRYI